MARRGIEWRLNILDAVASDGRQYRHPGHDLRLADRNETGSVVPVGHGHYAGCRSRPPEARRPFPGQIIAGGLGLVGDPAPDPTYVAGCKFLGCGRLPARSSAPWMPEPSRTAPIRCSPDGFFGGAGGNARLRKAHAEYRELKRHLPKSLEVSLPDITPQVRAFSKVREHQYARSK